MDKAGLLNSPAFSIMAGAILSALIIISVVISITGLVAGVTIVVVFYTYRFVTKQIMVIKTFALGYLRIILEKYNKIIK